MKWQDSLRIRAAAALSELQGDRGLVACTATEAPDAVHRCPRSIRNEWGMSLVAMNVGEES